MKTAKWFVPPYDKALPAQWKIADISYVYDGTGYKIQVTPLTFADVKLCNTIADMMNAINREEQ